MSEGLNQFTGLGNLCEDPELRTTQSGQPVLHGRIAINGGYLDKDKVWKATCEYVSFVVWGARATALSKILSTGKQILIQGALRTTSFDRDGQKVWKTEVNCTNVILTGNRKSDGQGEDRSGGGGEDDAPPARSGGKGGGYQRGGEGQGRQQRSGGGGGYSNGGGGGQRQDGGQQHSQGNTQRSQGGGGGGSGGRSAPPPPEADTQNDGGYGADDDIPF